MNNFRVFFIQYVSCFRIDALNVSNFELCDCITEEKLQRFTFFALVYRHSQFLILKNAVLEIKISASAFLKTCNEVNNLVYCCLIVLTS